MLPMYYLIDTNIIIAYIKNESLALVTFIDTKENKFYYTETVKKEIGSRHIIPDIFTFANSQLIPKAKEDAFQALTKDFGLEGTKMLNDFFIVFEAGFVCFTITDIDDFREPILLTNNLKLYKKYIARPTRRMEFEDQINLHGFEHLIEVRTPQEIIPGY